jgi:hypothetical protein
MLRFELRSGCYLRLFEESDAEELDRVIAANRAYLAEWLDWANAEGTEEWLAFIRRTREKVAANDGFCAAVIDDGAIVGWVGFDRIDWDSRSTSIGYWLARDRRGGAGIVPPLERQPDFPPAVLGYAMAAYYGGRAECRVRRTPMPVVYVDYVSMYATVNALMGLWRPLRLSTRRRCQSIATVGPHFSRG